MDREQQSDGVATSTIPGGREGDVQVEVSLDNGTLAVET